MQQVESKHRFWWRAAHDAPTPGTDAAQAKASLRDVSPTTRSRAAAASVSGRGIGKLEIARGGRRSRRARRERHWAKFAVVVALVALAGAATAFALPKQLKKLEAMDLSSKADEVMIAAGFGIDQVNLSGQHFTSDSDVYDALDLTNVKTFAAFDSDAVMKRLERIPWIDTVQLTRVYPGTLDVVIHERSPAFVWTRGDTNYLVDKTGRTLGPMPAASTWNLPRVVGEGADSEAMPMLAAVRQCPIIEKQYAYGERVAERRWRIVLKNGTALELAADREIENLQEIANARAVRSALTGTPMIIDVRTPGRIAMRPALPASAPTASLTAAGTTFVASAQQ